VALRPRLSPGVRFFPAGSPRYAIATNASRRRGPRFRWLDTEKQCEEGIMRARESPRAPATARSTLEGSRRFLISESRNRGTLQRQ